jgi:DNA-binding NarL/FixJ family response regulator
VLIADDHKILRAAVRDVLERDGCEVCAEPRTLPLVALDRAESEVVGIPGVSSSGRRMTSDTRRSSWAWMA